MPLSVIVDKVTVMVRGNPNVGTINVVTPEDYGPIVDIDVIESSCNRGRERGSPQGTTKIPIYVEEEAVGVRPAVYVQPRPWQPRQVRI
jgi:hypothetical protein